MEIKNVTVCGSGVLGGQIAFQSAFHHFNVVAFDVDQEVLKKLATRFLLLGEAFKQDLGATQSEVEQAISRVTFSTDLAEATKDADLVIEAVPENVPMKKEFYHELGKLAPAKAIFCTNTSTFLPSLFAEDTGRPERFLALHFANNIWKQNTAEIMGHANTDPVVFDTIVDFAKKIGMLALPIYKEQPGYILNTLLVPFLQAGLSLYVNEVSDPHTIDKTWMKAMNAPLGPFATLDVIGMNTPYNLYRMQAGQGNEFAKKVVKLLKEEFIDKGKLGVSTGEGFYTYPNPAYANEDFLKV
jgi:3-hydroxyacyl-CoA dehydrogenase